MPVLIIMFKGVIGDIVSPITNGTSSNSSAAAVSQPNNLITNPSSHTFYSAFRKESFLNSSIQSLNSNKNHSQLVSTYIISDTDRRANASSIPRKQNSVGNNSLERITSNSSSNNNPTNSNNNGGVMNISNNNLQLPTYNFGLGSNRSNINNNNNYLNSIQSIL